MGSTNNQIHEGSINYKIKTHSDGSWEVEYESSTENDIAALAIAQNLSEYIVVGLDNHKNAVSTTKEKKHLQAILDKARSARFGLKVMIDYMQPIYEEFKKKQDGKDDKNQ